jgi:hypothetical protein
MSKIIHAISIEEASEKLKIRKDSQLVLNLSIQTNKAVELISISTVSIFNLSIPENVANVQYFL